MRQVLNLLSFSLRVMVNIVLGQFLVYLPFFVIHECVKFFDVELATSEIDILVELRINH